MIITSSAPIDFATNIQIKPMGPEIRFALNLILKRTDYGIPAPVTKTLDPIVTPARRHAWTPTLKGSQNAPSS